MRDLPKLSDIPKTEIPESQTQNRKTNCLEVRSANVWLKEAASRPIPKMLFGELWFEGELCILFADTNLGKSILAVQIADSIAGGIGINPFCLEATSQKVLYLDFELSDKQFEARYSKREDDFFTDHFPFSDNFFRAEINPNVDQLDHFSSFEEFLVHSLSELIAELETEILIVDNLTYLRRETEKAKDALPLMKELKHLKTKFGLSILVLAHTPKRDLSKPITRNDLQGSKMLINFCDSAFAIGESVKDSSLRYLKQIKARNTSIIYDMENVATFEIEKPENFLRFEFVEFGTESEHLRHFSEANKKDLKTRIKDLAEKGFSQRQIAEKIRISQASVCRYLNQPDSSDSDDSSDSGDSDD
jgi:RecA-family ATPase